MKIVIFAPHPDDEVFGCGGSILKWIEEGHNIDIVYITDNRALISWGRSSKELIEELTQEYLHLTEDEIGNIGLNEAIQSAKAFGIPEDKIHLFKFHDQHARKKINEGIMLAKEIIKEADRIVIPSDNNRHPDHQATHIMVKEAALELSIENTEFYVYTIHSQMKIPKDKQTKIKIMKYRSELFQIMALYRTQIATNTTRIGWLTLKRKVMERFGVFQLREAGNYYNF